MKEGDISRMNKKKFFIVSVFVVILGIALIALVKMGVPPAMQPEKVVEIEAHWSKSFNNLSEMVADSDLIITGRVLKVQASRLISDPYTSPRAQEFGLPNGVVFTDHVIQVDRVIKGNARKDGIVIVVQTGGRYNGVNMVVEDSPLFERNELVLLFLKDISGDPIQAPNEKKYIINGSPQARFKIVNGKVVSGMPDNAFANQFQGRQENEFINQIAAVVR